MIKTIRQILDALIVVSIITFSAIALVVGVIELVDRMFPEEKPVEISYSPSNTERTFFDMKARKAIRFFPDGTVHLIDLDGAVVFWETRESFLNWANDNALKKWGETK